MSNILWPCGHRRTAPNTSRRGTCRACMANRMREARRKLKPPPTKWLRCDHPRTPENTEMQGTKPRCRECVVAYRHGLRKKNCLPGINIREFAPRPLPIRPQVAGRSYRLAPEREERRA